MKPDSLMARVKRSRNAKGYSQKQVAEAIGMSQPSYYKIENGLTKRSGYINDIAKVLGVEVDWLIDGIESTPAENSEFLIAPSNSSKEVILRPEDAMVIPVYNILLCWNDKTKIFYFEEIDGYHTFSSEFFTKRNIKPKDFKMVLASSESMAPYINDKDQVGIVLNDTSIRDGQVYAVLLDGEFMFKRVFREAGGVLRLNSFNSSYPDRLVTTDNNGSLIIVGRQNYRAG